MKNWTRLGLGALTVVALAACDQREERLQKAGELYDAVREQIAEEALGQTIDRSPLERAKPEERAFAGRLMSETEVSAQAAPQASRFAVGSIIAKPAALTLIEEIEAAEPLEMEVYAPVVDGGGDEDAFEELPVLELPREGDPNAAPPRVPQRTVQRPVDGRQIVEIPDAASREIARKIEKRPMVKERMRQIELPDLEEIEPVPVPPVREAVRVQPAPRVMVPGAPITRQEMKVARRMVMSSPKEQVQEAARDRMQGALEKYGLQGTVVPDRGGQMKIELFADGPTQFTPQAEPVDRALPRFAIYQRGQSGCPDDVSPQTVQQDPVLATECVIETLRESGEFDYVEKDFIMEHQFSRKPNKDQVIAPTGGQPNDPLFGFQWHYKDNGAEAGQSPGGAGFAGFWATDAALDASDIVIAVVDTGLQMEHPDIKDSRNIKPGYDFVSDPRMGNDGDGRDADPNDPGDLCDPTDPFASDSFHGTHVAGVIGAASTNNRRGIAGGVWNVSIVPVRAMGRCGGRLSDINEAIRWSAGLIPAFTDDGDEIWNDNPADIINLSLGLFESCPASLQDAIDAVTERGVIVVAAAGNARISTQFYAPGGCRNVVSVAAGDGRGQIAPYSNYGAEVDILAPGGDLTRDDDGDGNPDGVLSTKFAKNCTDPVTGQAQATCDYAFEQGTSMAAPHVSAAFALLMAKYPDFTRDELIARLLSAVEPREDTQCAGQCSSYPGATPIPDRPGLCARPCGTGLLNLARISGP